MANLLQRTVLQISQAAADNIGFTRPATLSDTVNLNDRRFLQAAQWAMRDIATAAPHSLVREYSFYTRSSVEAYPLPGDFGGFVNNTSWNRTQQNPNELVGGALWQQNKSGIADTAYLQRYRMKGYNDQLGRFFIDPLPTSVEKEVFDYQSNGMFLEADPGTAKDRQIYVEQANSGSQVLVSHSSTSLSIPSVFLVTNNRGSGGRNMEGRVFTWSSGTTSSNGRHKVWLQGTDGRDFDASGSLDYRAVVNYLTTGVLLETAIPLVDSDIVELGMIYRLKRMVGQPYVAEQIAFQDAMEVFIGKKKGASIISLSGRRTGLSANTQEGNFGL